MRHRYDRLATCTLESQSETKVKWLKCQVAQSQTAQGKCLQENCSRKMIKILQGNCKSHPEYNLMATVLNDWSLYVSGESSPLSDITSPKSDCRGSKHINCFLRVSQKIRQVARVTIHIHKAMNALRFDLSVQGLPADSHLVKPCDTVPALQLAAGRRQALNQASLTRHINGNLQKDI